MIRASRISTPSQKTISLKMRCGRSGTESKPGFVILKFTSTELAKLQTYELGPFGLGSFESFMAEICARTNHETGEVDMDRDDFEKINDLRLQGHGRKLDPIFTRLLD